METRQSPNQEENNYYRACLLALIEFIINVISRQGDMILSESRAHIKLVNHKLGLLKSKLTRLQVVSSHLNVKIGIIDIPSEVEEVMESSEEDETP